MGDASVGKPSSDQHGHVVFALSEIEGPISAASLTNVPAADSALLPVLAKRDKQLFCVTGQRKFAIEFKFAEALRPCVVRDQDSLEVAISTGSHEEAQVGPIYRVRMDNDYIGAPIFCEGDTGSNVGRGSDDREAASLAQEARYSLTEEPFFATDCYSHISAHHVFRVCNSTWVIDLTAPSTVIYATSICNLH